jgi:uroporphyrinogen decarboxylase
MTTQLEQFFAATNHQRPDKLLFYAHFTPDLRNRVCEYIGTEDIEKHFGMFQPEAAESAIADQYKPLDFTKYWENQTLSEGSFINHLGVVEVPSGFYHFTGYISPLRNATSISELETYPITEVRHIDFAPVRKMVEDAHSQGRVARAWIGHMYEDAWQIRGYEQFLVDMLDHPSWAECLLERLFQKNYILAEGFAKAGVDLFTTGDDVANQRAMMFDVKTWRNMMLSRWKKVWRRIKEVNPNAKIWYHSDGNIFDIIPDLIEAGVDILNPVQPECLDLDDVHRKFGKKLTFDGCMGTQTTMPFGSSDDVRCRVEEIIAKYGQNGGLIISPTHILEPEVPLANIQAFYDACRSYSAEPV